jgi:serine/threonine protein kinase
MLGTLRYAAPEQLNGIAAPSCDIYGLGITLYEIVTLAPAHHAVNQLQLLEEVRSVDPTHPRRVDPAIPRDLETIIVTAMAKDPQRRYRSAQELARVSHPRSSSLRVGGAATKHWPRRSWPP